MKDELFICNECGNTSPIPNEECSVCGGKMIHKDDLEKDSHEHALDEDGESGDSIPYTEPSSGYISLEEEKSKESEEDESQDNYGGSSSSDW